MKKIEISGGKNLFKKALLFIVIAFIVTILVQTTTIAATMRLDGLTKINLSVNGKTMYYFDEETSTYTNLYCLNGGARMREGSVATIGGSIYNLSDEEIKTIFTTRENYNSVMWILDNLYINNNANATLKATMIENIAELVKSQETAIEKTYNVTLDENWIDGMMADYATRENLIFAVQQCLIWHYTNNQIDGLGVMNSETIKGQNGLAVPGDGNLNTNAYTQTKYYMYIYTALYNLAEQNKNYVSPNATGMQANMQKITLDSTQAKVDRQNKLVGPFVLGGTYSTKLNSFKKYTVKVNGTVLSENNYDIQLKENNKIYIQFKNGYEFKDDMDYTISINVNLKQISTSARYLYPADIIEEQPMVNIEKSIASVDLSGKVETSAIAEFDLHLSKNIVEIYEPNYDENGNVSGYRLKYCGTDNTAQQINAIKNRIVSRVGNLRYGADTDTYLTNKTPITVAPDDIIKYKITIHNEGDIDGYAEEVTDYLASGLSYVKPTDYGINDTVDYGWKKVQQDATTGVTEYSTNYLSSSRDSAGNLIKAYNAEENKLDSKAVYIYCKVTGTDAGKLLKNVAEITADKAVKSNGEDVADRDSTPNSIPFKDLTSGIDTWEGNSSNIPVSSMNDYANYNVTGKQDDDDFENVRIQNFDLSLTKEIQSVHYETSEGRANVGIQTRLRYYKTDRLSTETTAKYVMNKSVVKLKVGAIIKYKITVYNEGDLAGYATEITDYLPAGLEFVADSEVNKANGWVATKNEDGTTTVKTTKLSNTELAAYAGKEELSNASVEIECKITGTEVGKILTNVAEITKYGYYRNNHLVEADSNKTDRDSIQNSIPNGSKSVSEYIKKYEQIVEKQSSLTAIDKSLYDIEDDDDFERVQIIGKEFDLALRKHISAINGENVVNGYDLTSYKENVTRIPTLSAYSMQLWATEGTAGYNHGKVAIDVYPEDEVTYTLRVYNEGGVADYNGYATEIVDYLPQGLEFVKLADGYEDYTAEVDEELNAVKITYNGNKILNSNSIPKLMSAIMGHQNGLELGNIDEYYQEVKLICKVTTYQADKILTNRAEITADKAFDIDGTEVQVEDRDSTPNSLLAGKTTVEEKEEILNLENYYYDYLFGINDDHIDYYRGLEGSGDDIKGRQDDIDFENIVVKKLSGEYSLQILKIDGKNSNKKLEGVTFEVKAFRNGKTETLNVNATDANGLTSTITTTISNEALIYDKYAITEINVGKNEYVTLSESIEFYVVKEFVKIEDGGVYRATGIYFEQPGEQAQEYEFSKPITKTVKLTDGREVEVTAVLNSKGAITVTIPNLEEHKDFDLALRKFITQINNETVTDRVPEFKIDENGNYTYNHKKDAVIVDTNDVVTYTLRIYNEGEAYGYATEIMDDIPDGLEFISYVDGDGSINDLYNWVLYREVKEGEDTEGLTTKMYNGKTYVVTADVAEADYIVTNYLSQENGKTMVSEEKMDKDTYLPYNPNLLKPFEKETMAEPDYRDIKVQFKVVEPSTSDRIITNYAQITEDKDKYNEEVEDIDSTPNEWIDGEDDQDTEKIKVRYFDLALLKWVSKAIIIEDGKETVQETGHTGEENPEPVVKVDLKKSKISDVVVKFEYQIKLTNEGEIDGYVKELSDYIPAGLKFDASEKTNTEYGWSQIEGKVVTKHLENKLLQPGESATVPIVLTWINGADNMGVKVNVAEISEDHNESNTPDIDSTPDNFVPGEDDIDDAPVMITVKTGESIVIGYIVLGLAVTAILSAGVILIKKFVIL